MEAHLPVPPTHPARGWLLIFLGTALSGGMAYLAHVIHAAIAQNDVPGARTHWNGTPEFTRTVFELFGTVFLFGLVGIAGGVYILRVRRVSRALGAIMVVLALAMAYFGYAIVQSKTPAN